MACHYNSLGRTDLNDCWIVLGLMEFGGRILVFIEPLRDPSERAFQSIFSLLPGRQLSEEVFQSISNSLMAQM